MLLKQLSSKKEILTKKVVKSNSVVVLNRHDYITSMNKILSDTRNFWKIVIKSAKETSYLLQLENTLISFLKNVEYSLSTNFY